MNNNTKAAKRRLRKKHPELFKHKVRVRRGKKGKVACQTYGEKFEWRYGDGRLRIGSAGMIA